MLCLQSGIFGGFELYLEMGCCNRAVAKQQNLVARRLATRNVSNVIVSPASFGDCRKQWSIISSRIQRVRKLENVFNRRISQKQQVCSSSSSRDQGDTAVMMDPLEKKRVSMLWYKHDLRLDDHPGIHKALEESLDIVPVFVFDPVRYAGLVESEEMAHALVDAVSSLRQSLQRLGSDLVVRMGPWEVVVPGLIRQFGCDTVIAEDECESIWSEGVELVKSKFHENGIKVDMCLWRCQLFSGYYVDIYPEWKSIRGQAVSPVSAPNSAMPAFPKRELEEGELDAHLLWKQIVPLKFDYAHWNGVSNGDAHQGVVLGEDVASALDNASLESWDAEIAIELCADEKRALEYLDGYVSYGTEEEDTICSPQSTALERAIEAFDTDASIDGCFPAIFLKAIELGTLSRRRIYYEAEKIMRERGGFEVVEPGNTFFSWVGWLLTSDGGALARRAKVRKAQAAVLASDIGDFHLCQSYEREGLQVQGGVMRHWRWKGLLTEYLVGEPDKPLDNAPAILLVHGFGAFGEHWRRNVKELADYGFRVYAPTFPGYGRSEKHSRKYGQDLWSSFLVSFVQNIVQEPVLVAGNSIGGFISASMAADYPHLVRGLVLLNSAGRIDPTYQPPESLVIQQKKPPPVFIVNAISSFLFKFLEGDIENQLKRLYPTRPENADQWLGSAIGRAANDPGALGVFRSVFYLPPPRPLNFLVQEKFRGPTLVLQGALDPLNDAVGRAKELEDTCSNVQVELLQAGHCPHDEVPEQVNKAIINFVRERIMEKMREKV